jgi:ubiquitin-protein ligase
MANHKRIQTEWLECKQEPIKGIVVRLAGEDMENWFAEITAPESSLYKGGVFVVSIKFSESHPFKHPVVRFRTRVFHPAIDFSHAGHLEVEGCIGRDLIRSGWSPKFSINRDVLPMLMSLFTEIRAPDNRENSEMPCRFYACNCKAMDLFQSDQGAFELKVRASVAAENERVAEQELHPVCVLASRINMMHLRAAFCFSPSTISGQSCISSCTAFRKHHRLRFVSKGGMCVLLAKRLMHFDGQCVMLMKTFKHASRVLSQCHFLPDIARRLAVQLFAELL